MQCEKSLPAERSELRAQFGLKIVKSLPLKTRKNTFTTARYRVYFAENAGTKMNEIGQRTAE